MVHIMHFIKNWLCQQNFSNLRISEPSSQSIQVAYFYLSQLIKKKTVCHGGPCSTWTSLQRRPCLGLGTANLAKRENNARVMLVNLKKTSQIWKKKCEIIVSLISSTGVFCLTGNGNNQFHKKIRQIRAYINQLSTKILLGPRYLRLPGKIWKKNVKSLFA